MIKDVALLADGKPLLTVTLGNRSGEQRFDLPQPAMFTTLTLRVHLGVRHPR